MVARIYKPSRNAMQSGVGKTRFWVLEYEPEHARMVEPLMGYTSSADMRSQIRLKFVSLRLSFCRPGGGKAQNSDRPSAVSFLQYPRFRSTNDEHPSILGNPEMVTSYVVWVLHIADVANLRPYL